MTIGGKIRQSRRARGMTLQILAGFCGKKKSWLSAVETDALKGGADPETMIKISEALGDPSILIYALLHNPICQRIMPRAFAPLNNIKTDPLVILKKLAEELEDAIESADILSRVLAYPEPQSPPNYVEVLMENMEQLIDVPRCIDETFVRLKKCGAITEEQYLEVYVWQQAKVEAHGHKPCECREVA